MNTESMGTGMPGGTQAKKAVYELAKELGVLNKDLVAKIRALGIDAKNHMSRLSEEDVERVKRALTKERQENTVQERVTDTVIRRRTRDGSMLRPQALHVPPPAPPAPPAPPVPSRSVEAPLLVARPASPVSAAPAAPEARSATPPAAAQVVRRKIVLPGQSERPRPPETAPVVSSPPLKDKDLESRPTAPPAAEKPVIVPRRRIDVVPPAAPVRPPVATPAPAPAPVVREVAPPKAPEPQPPVISRIAPPVAEAPPARPVQKPSEPVAVAEPPRPAVPPPAPAPVAAPPAPAVVRPAKPAVEPVTAPAPIAAAPTPPPAPASAPQAARPATPSVEAAEEPAVAAPPESSQSPRVFVTAQTRRQSEGLGPTGRVIDLAAFRPPTPPPAPKPSSESPPRVFRSDDSPMGRGPRQEVTGERLRPQDRKSAMAQKAQKQKPVPGRKPKQTQITTAAEHKRVVKMGEAIVIAEFARQMGAKATDVLKKIWELGIRNVMINSPIDFDTAQLVAAEFEWRVESTAFQEESVVNETVDQPADLQPRAPVITIMGHVDHGKTSLLDAIRNANVAAGEAGGITQHIGAYRVSTKNGDVVFLDTPGHEAFTEMRARGAQVTDIVVLVVAADDGVMPQTVEALNHARDAEVPIIVAVNKIDKPGAQPDRIRQQLSGHGLQPEEWGGQTIYCDVSARAKLGIDKLLEMLALQSEVLELKANPDKPAKGVVIEARMDSKRGPVATMLVQEGTLRIGDSVVVGEELGKVRAMMDDKGRQLQSAGPSTPVEVLGLSGVPRAGEVLNVVSDERSSKELVEHRRQRRIEKERAKAGPVSLDKLMDAMKAGLKELKIILKADVQGSVEALSSALSKLSTPQVKVTVIQAAVGGITETDVNLAKAGNAVIIGFHVRPAGKAAALAEQEGVDIKLYDIIYDALDEVKQAMAGLLAPVKRDKNLGKAEVRELFTIPKIGVVSGCSVLDGIIKRSSPVRLIRDSVLIYTGKLGSLRRFKEDVREVQQGYECGMTIEGYQDIKVGDIIECFEVEEIAATLD